VFEEEFVRLVDRFDKRPKDVDFTERDTATKFLLPLIRALGWNIYDIREVREEISAAGVAGSVDCVLYLEDAPVIVWEFKSLSTRIYDTGRKAVFHQVMKSKIRGLQVAKALSAKYFVMSNFIETVIWDVKNDKIVAVGYFSSEDLDTRYKKYRRMMWQYLSKENVTP